MESFCKLCRLTWMVLVEQWMVGSAGSESCTIFTTHYLNPGFVRTNEHHLHTLGIDELTMMNEFAKNCDYDNRNLHKNCSEDHHLTHHRRVVPNDATEERLLSAERIGIASMQGRT